MSLTNFSDKFVSYVFVQLGDLKHLEFFSTDRPTDRQTDRPTNLLIEAPFRSLKINPENIISILNNELCIQIHKNMTCFRTLIFSDFWPLLKHLDS